MLRVTFVERSLHVFGRYAKPYRHGSRFVGNRVAGRLQRMVEQCVHFPSMLH
jgi:hypothetical protein